MRKSQPISAWLACCIAGVGLISAGCSDPSVGMAPPVTGKTPVANKVSSPAKMVKQDTNKAVKEVQGIAQKASDAAKEESSGVLGKAADLLEQAKSAAPTVGGTKKWLGDRFSDASDATGQTADDTSKWISDTYQSLKDNGLTTADNAQDWLKEDWKNIGAWDYKVVIINSVRDAGTAEKAEQQLNELGSDRWQCFNVSESENGTVMYFKRSRDSYLKHVPLRDVLHFVPFMKALDNGGDGAGE